MREMYDYELNYQGKIATIKKLPPKEKAGLVYNWHLIAHLVSLLSSLPYLLLTYLNPWGKKYPYQDYQDYFFLKFSPYPDREFLHKFDNDIYLGLQRVAGMNPTVIEGITEDNPLPENFKAQHLVKELTQQSYEDALQAKRLYLTDYSRLEMIADNLAEEEGYQKYVANPIALYYREDNGLLRPLAIQLYGTQPTCPQNNPIYTPGDKEYWLMARTYLQAADATYHELWTHTTRIHYVMESIIIASYRNLARSHPLFALLYPHLRYTLFVDYHPFFEPDKNGKIPAFSKMFAGTNDVLIEFIGAGMREYHFHNMAFNNDIKNRNMEDEQLFYPYRDDGKLVWNAIHDFVNQYINLYYQADQDVIEDYELQAWAKEIGASEEKKDSMIPGFPTTFQTINEVVATLENIIFIATAHHSCIHFPQYQYAGYIPNMPFSVYAPPAQNFQGFMSKSDLMKLFPPFPKAFYQTWIFYLANFKVDRLGDYNLNQFDTESKEIIKNFQKKLEEVSQEVDNRNQKRLFSYSYMNPKNIPNTVSI
jgi:arachidonate 15-lipoxygenase